jgi:hypothetical protein
MKNAPPIGYRGKELPQPVRGLLNDLAAEGFDVRVSGEGKTIRIGKNGRRGYVNADVLRDGVIGYVFGRWGRDVDACPPELAESIIRRFCDRYGCFDSDVAAQSREMAGRPKTYLVIRNPAVALRVLRAEPRRRTRTTRLGMPAAAAVPVVDTPITLG